MRNAYIMIFQTPWKIFLISCFVGLKILISCFVGLILDSFLLAFLSCYMCYYSTNTLILVRQYVLIFVWKYSYSNHRTPTKAQGSSEAIPGFGLALNWAQCSCGNEVFVGKVWGGWLWLGLSFSIWRNLWSSEGLIVALTLAPSSNFSSHSLF